MSVIQGGIRDEYVRVNLGIVDGAETVYTGSNIYTGRIMISSDMTGRYGWNIFENFDDDSTNEIGISEFLVLWSSY